MEIASCPYCGRILKGGYEEGLIVDCPECGERCELTDDDWTEIYGEEIEERKWEA